MSGPVADSSRPRPPRAARGWVGRFYGSTLGKKVTMALSGVVVIGYLVVHAAGNLLVFRGPDAIDGYARFLHENPALVWTVRVVLLAAIVIHVHAGLALTARARSARTARYAALERPASSLASRTMRAGGVLLLAFIIFHLLHFTVGSLHPAFVRGEVYRNVVVGFGVVPVAVFYLGAMVALALHLRHGVWSAFQTLGLNHPHLEGVRHGLAWLLAIGLSVGFALVPLAVLLGWIG